MKILFVRPPRYMWPMTSESSSFWQPLGFLSMAGSLQQAGHTPIILDCLILNMGWKSLTKYIANAEFDILCVGDETASYHEAVRLSWMVKQKKPQTIIVAGGYHFSHTIRESFEESPIDIIVQGEGEKTIVAIANALEKGQQLSSLDGIAFKDTTNENANKKEKIIITKSRELIKSLDELPLLPYKLLPMQLYGKKSTNHNDFASIEHGRGCIDTCSFCSIWNQMSNNGKACYRTKSAQRSFEETKLLVEKYKRKTLNWVDGTFNADPKWSKEYFRLLKKNKIKIQHTTWMRSDCIIRDEQLGIMKEMADGGVVQAVIGIERLTKKGVLEFNARNKELDTTLKAAQILKKYPHIQVIGTLIYGTPQDTWKDLEEINNFMQGKGKYKDIPQLFDWIFLLPYTPYPGSPVWKQYKQKFGKAQFSKWNLTTPVMGTNTISQKKLQQWYLWTIIKYKINIRSIGEMLSSESKRKKLVRISLMGKAAGAMWQLIKAKIMGRDFSYGIKPKWYDD